MSGVFPASTNVSPGYGYGQTPVPTPPQPSFLAQQSTIASMFGLEATSAQAAGTEQAEEALATGAEQEETAYGTAAAVAQANARLATIGGTVEQAQQQLQLTQTLGSQRAAVAGGGFAESGSALDILRASTQQGLFEQQITGVNAALQSGGYEQQVAASQAEQTAAAASATSAQATATAAAQLSSLTKTQAANEAAAMNVNLTTGVGPGPWPTPPTPAAPSVSTSLMYAGTPGHIII